MLKENGLRHFKWYKTEGIVVMFIDENIKVHLSFFLNGRKFQVLFYLLLLFTWLIFVFFTISFVFIQQFISYAMLVGLLLF